MLEHRLAAAERTRYEACAAFRYRVESVDHPDSGLHYAGWTRFLPVALDGHLYRPSLGHRHLHVLAFLIDQDGDHLVHVVFSGPGYALDRIFALEGERNHYLVVQPAFLDVAEPVCCDHLVAGLCQRGEFPELFVVEGVGVFPSLEEDACHCGEVILQSVVAAGKQTRTKGHLKHLVLELDAVSVL